MPQWDPNDMSRFTPGAPDPYDPNTEEDWYGVDPTEFSGPTGPSQSLYARAAMGLGLDVAQVQSIWEAELGPTGMQGKASYDLWSTLESHVRTTQFGGGPIGVPKASMWEFQHSHPARQEILRTALPVPDTGEVPAGWMQYGKQMWPQATVTASLGVGLSQEGELSFGLPPEKEAKAIKHTRGAPGVQQHAGVMTGLPAPTPGHTIGSTATQPEMMQAAHAFVSFDQPMAEGMSAYDPSHWGQFAKPILGSVRIPKEFDVTQVVQPGTEFAGKELAQFFPGHTGERYSQYDKVVVNAAGVVPITGGEAADRGYQQLLVQMTGYAAPSSVISQKAGVAKGGGVAMPVAGMFGDVGDPVGGILEGPQHDVQPAKPVTAWFQARDVEQLAALHTRQMTPEQQVSIYGKEVPKWDPDLYQTWHEKILAPGLQEHTLAPRAFNLQDPRTQARLEAGKLQETERIDEHTIMAQQKTVGIALDLGMQQSMVWEHQKGLVPFELAGEISRVHPEMAEYYSTLSRGRQRTLANIGGAAMFNAGKAEGYQTTPVEDVPWTSLTAQAMGRLEEQGVKDPMRALPGQLGQALMMEMGKEVGKGRGLMFPKPGGGKVAMPNPAAVESYLSGAPVEGMRFGLPRAYTSLLGTYQKMQEGRATEKEYGTALTEAQTQLSKVVSSAGFSRRMTGWDVGSGALTGGRVAPTEGLPMHRFTAGREWLREHMQFEPGLTGKQREGAVSDVMAGKEDFLTMAFRQPVSLAGIQTRSIMRYMGPAEAEKSMGMDPKAYKERFTSAVGLHPTWGAATQFGDFDIDPWAFLAASVVEKDPETGRTKFRRLASGGMSEKDILGLATMDIGGEVGSDIKKIQAVESVQGALAWAAERHVRITPERLTEISTQAEEERARQGPVYNFAERQVRWGLKAAAEQATGKGATALTVAAEEMGKYYLGAQSRAVSMADQEAESATGFNRLLDIYRSASTASGGGISGDKPIYYQGQSGMIGAAFSAVSEMGELSSRSKAALVMSPSLPGFERVKAIMEETAGMKGGAKRGRLLGEAIGLVMPGQQQDFAQWATRGVLGEILGGAASKRGYAEQLAHPEGKRTATGVRTTAMSEEAISLAGRGVERQGFLTTLYKAGLGEMPIEERVSKWQGAAGGLPAAERGLLTGAMEAMHVSSVSTPATAPTERTAAPVTPPVVSRRTPGLASTTATTPDATWTKGRIYQWAQGQGRTGRGGDISMAQTKGQMLSTATGPTVSATPAPGTATTPLPTQVGSPGVSGLWSEATQRMTGVLGGIDPSAAEAPAAMAGVAQRSLGGQDVGGGQTVMRRQLNEMIAAHPGQAAQVQQVWEARMRATGMTMAQFGETRGHQYAKFLEQSRAPGGAGAAGAGATPPTGGGGLPGGLGSGGPAGRGFTRFTRSATGEEFVSGGFTPSGGISNQQKAIMGAMEKYQDSLSARADQLRQSVAQGRKLTQAELKTATVLGTYHSQMTQAVQEAKAAGLTGQQAMAQGAVQQLEGMGMPALGAQAQVQQQLMGMGVIQPPSQRAERAGQAFRSVFSGWEMMRMRRMWNMTGGPVFQQMIPAAAQAEIPGWEATVAMGGFQPGMAPGGVAGGLMAQQAAQRQGMIAAGRTGYRAWSWAMKPTGGLKQAQAMFGPALGVGAIAGSIAGIAAPLIAPGAVAGLSAAGIAGAVSLPIAIGVAGILGTVAIGASAYQAGGSTAENALRMAQIGREERVRARKQPVWEGGVGGDRGGISQAWQTGLARAGRMMRGEGFQAAGETIRQQARRGQGLWTQQLAGMPAEDRMAALNAAAQGLQGTGGVWDIMDEPQIVSLVSQFTAYKPDMTAAEIARGPEWLEQAAVTGRTPATFAPVARAMGMGQQGALGLFEQWGGLPAGQLMQYTAAAEALAPMGRFGMTPERMVGQIEAGWEAPSGQAGQLWGQLLGGDRHRWSQMAAMGEAPAWMGVTEPAGLAVGTTDFGQLWDVSLSGMQERQRMGSQTGLYTSAGGMEAWGNMPEALMRPTGGQLPLSGGGFVQTPVGGQWGLQDWQRAEQRQYQDFQVGQQRQQMTGRRAFTLQMRGFEDRSRALSFGGAAAMLGIQQRGIYLATAQFGEQQELASEQMGAQAAMWAESRGAQFRQQMTRFDWREQDLRRGRGQQLKQREYKREDLERWRERTDVRLDWQGEDITRQFGRGGIRLDRAAETMGIQWGRQQIGFAQAEQDMARGWARQETQTAWAQQDITRGWGQQQTQMGWAREDFQFQRAGAQLQFGWQMEDIEENIRFATGRQRKQLITQRERAATMFGRQEGKAATDEERMGQREEWATEEHRLTQERFTERTGWAEEDHQIQAERLEERRGWATEDHTRAQEQLEEQRTWLNEDHATASERFEQRKEWASEDYLTRLGRLEDVSKEEDEVYSDKLQRLGVQRKWAQEDYARDIAHHGIRIGFQEKRMLLSLKHFTERQVLAQARHDAAAGQLGAQYALQTEILDAKRRQQDKEYEWEVEAFDRADAHRRTMRDIEDIQVETSRSQELALAEWKAFYAIGGPFMKALDRIGWKLQDIVNGLRAPDPWD